MCKTMNTELNQTIQNKKTFKKNLTDPEKDTEFKR